MHFIQRILNKSEMVKNGFMLLSSSTVAQLLAVIFYPIITRQYSPAELGAVSLFLSIVGIGSILATAQYESAILLESEEVNAVAVFDLTFLINLGITGFALTSLLLFKNSIIKLFNVEGISQFLWLIPVMIFLTTLGFVFTYWFNRQNRFSYTARYNLVQSASNSTMKVFLGAISYTHWGLFVSSIWGQIAGIGSVIFNKSLINPLFQFNKKRMSEVAIRHFKFPVYTLPHAFINTIAGNLPVLILSAWFNMTEVGLFSLGVTLGFRPISMLTTSMNQVFFQKVSSNKNNGVESYSLLLRFCKKAIYITLPLFAIAFVIIKPATVLIFGAAWIGAGVYLQLMLPWFFISILTSTLCFMPALVGKQRQAMILEIIYTGLRAGALLIGVLHRDIYLAVLLFSLVTSFCLAAFLIWYLLLAKKMFR